MTNTELLRRSIDASGLKVGFIAKKMGISRQSLWKKINNIVPFDQYEIDKLCSVLAITNLEHKEDIFFARM